MAKEYPRDWWKEPCESVVSDLKTKDLLKEARDTARIKAKGKYCEEKKEIGQSIHEKHYSTMYWANLYGYHAETLNSWCKQSLIQAKKIRGQWRISESAWIEFLEEERKRHA